MARNDLGERQVHFIDDDGDKTTFTLRFTSRAIMAMENEMEMEAGEIEQKFRAGSIRTIAAMLWAGCIKHHRRDVPNVDKAGDLLDDIEDMDKFSTALFEAFVAGMPGSANAETESENGSPKAKKGKKLEAVSAGDAST